MRPSSITLVDANTSLVEMSAALIRNAMKNSTAAASTEHGELLPSGDLRVPGIAPRTPGCACPNSRGQAVSRPCGPDALGPPGRLHLGFVEMVAALGEFLSDLPFDRPEHVVVGGVVLLDDLERPVAGNDVAAEDLPFDLIGPAPVSRRAEQPYGIVEGQVGASGELVEVVQGALARSAVSSAFDRAPSASTVVSVTPSGRRCRGSGRGVPGFTGLSLSTRAAVRSPFLPAIRRSRRVGPARWRSVRPAGGGAGRSSPPFRPGAAPGQPSSSLSSSSSPSKASPISSTTSAATMPPTTPTATPAATPATTRARAGARACRSPCSSPYEGGDPWDSWPAMTSFSQASTWAFQSVCGAAWWDAVKRWTVSWLLGEEPGGFVRLDDDLQAARCGDEGHLDLVHGVGVAGRQGVISISW